MTENAYKDASGVVDRVELEDRATWAVNSLLESGDDVLAADLAAAYAHDLQHNLPRSA